MRSKLNDRMRRYYEAPSRHLLTRRTPVIVRVDGRAFHTFTRNFRRPFDQRLIDAMVVAASTVAGEMQGFKLGFIQSDEASFVLTDYDTLQTDAWFGYIKSKVETITASIMTAAFARCMRLANVTAWACFDARAFNVPSNDVANYFLGRARDGHRNSVMMYARTYFSHAKLKNKHIPEIHEMLHGVGRNWSTDLSDEEKNGTFLVDGSDESRSDIEPHYNQIAPLWESVEPCEPPAKSQMKSQVKSRATGNGRVENENDSVSNGSRLSPRNGARGSGT